MENSYPKTLRPRRMERDANAPATFQHFINHTFREFLDDFVAAYLDDIVIYSDTLEKHKVHVRCVLSSLKRAGIHLNPAKCQVHVQTTNYLGLILPPGGISMDHEQLAAIQEWGCPANLHDVPPFLGFANFHRRFILSYSRIESPLTGLTKK